LVEHLKGTPVDRNINIQIALGLVLGAVLTATGVAYYQTADAAFDLETLGKVAGIFVAPFTLALVALSWVLARETRQTWVQNRLPHVVVTIEPTPVSFMYADLVVENVGGGPAFDVEARFDPELKIKDERRPSSISAHSILRPPTLKPKQRICTLLGRWHGISPRRATVRCTCKDAAGVEHTFINVVDMGSYEGLSVLGGEPLQKISNEVEQMRKAIENLSTGWRRLEVNTHDAADRAAEQSAQDEHFRQLSARQAGTSGSE
jgi:hypothetical protein